MSLNLIANSVAFASYAALSDQVFLGFRISDGTPGHAVGIWKLKIGNVSNVTFSKSPFSASVISARVYFKLIRLPMPYTPPVIPVLINQTFAPLSFNFLPNISAYFVGCNGKNAAPKQAEKVVCGSVTPASVPATLDV